MGIVTGIATAIAVAARVAEAAKTAREMREILSGESLSPGDAREFAERFAKAAEMLAEAQKQFADAHTRIAESATQMVAVLAVATTALNQGIAILEQILELAKQQGLDQQSIGKLKQLLPSKNDDEPPAADTSANTK